jgi:hypothetical protein
LIVYALRLPALSWMTGAGHCEDAEAKEDANRYSLSPTPCLADTVRRRYSASRRYSAHWGSDREPSDSFESVRFDSRSPNFLREVRRTYYIVCVDNVTFDPDYDAIQKRPFGIFKKETTWELPKRSRRDHRLRRPNKRSNKVATPHSMRPAAQPLLVGAD